MEPQLDTCKPADQRRRRFTQAFKEQIVAQSLEPGASVSAIARANDLNANQVFKWKRQALGTTPTSAPTLIPVQIVQDTVEYPAQQPPVQHHGQIEVVLRRGTLRLEGPVNMDVLRELMSGLAS